MEINILRRLLPTVAVIVFIFYSAIYLLFYRRRKLPFIRHVTLYVFIGYCLSLIYLTILWYWPDITFLPGYYSLNLKPFIWLNETYYMGAARMAKQLLLNIAMFIPYGLLLPMTFKKLRRFWKTAAVALATTVLIETLQYFLGRSADIDDVIMNLAGGMLGYLLFYLLNRLLYKRRWWQNAIGIAA